MTQIFRIVVPAFFNCWRTPLFSPCNYILFFYYYLFIYYIYLGATLQLRSPCRICCLICIMGGRWIRLFYPKKTVWSSSGSATTGIRRAWKWMRLVLSVTKVCVIPSAVHGFAGFEQVLMAFPEREGGGTRGENPFHSTPPPPVNGVWSFKNLQGCACGRGILESI